MGRAIAVTQTVHAASDLWVEASRCRDGAQVRRLLALALIPEGHTRTEAAKRSGMERQTLRDRVHRYNATGVAGLKSDHGPGQPASLNDAQMAELNALVIKGPDPEKPRVVRWRGCRSWCRSVLSPRSGVPNTACTTRGTPSAPGGTIGL